MNRNNFNINKRLWQLFIVLLLTAKATAGPVTYFILEDKNLNITAEEALHLFQRNAYSQLNSNQFNPGFTKSVYWLAVKIDDLRNPDSFRLIIGQPVINKIGFYKVEASKPLLVYQTGDHYLYKHRPILTTEYSFPLSANSHLYLLRIDKHNESLQLTFNTLDSTEFISSQNTRSIITGLLTGIIVLLLIFGIYLTIITGKKIYIFYILYITAGWLWVLSDLGYGYKYLWPNSIWFASRSRPLFCDLTIALSLQYLIYYLGSIKNLKLRKALLITSYVAFLSVALWLIPVEVYEARELSWIMLLSLPLIVAVYILLTIATLFIEARNKNVMALFYLGALIPLLVLTLINILNHSALINISGSFLEQYGVAVGYVCEAIILTFGLAYRFNTYRLEKEILHVAFERQQKENAKSLIDIEAKERRRIADELHDIAGSMLSAARLNISSLRENHLLQEEQIRLKLEKAEEALSIVSGSVRNLSHALSPIMLDKIGFKKAILNITSFFTSSGKIEIETIIIGFEKYDPKLDNIYTILYSIVYEFLNNITKHSSASNAILQIIEHEDSITLIVEDNGLGFKREFSKENTKGLAGIISKINYFNGSIEFDSSDKGLIISIEIPKAFYEIQDSSGR